MEEKAQVDWDKLKNPPGKFKLIEPDPDTLEFHQRVVKLKDHLLNHYLETSDEHRNEQWLDYMIRCAQSMPGSAMYEWGDFQALVGFVGTIPTFKCGMSFNLIDKKVWGKEFVRAGMKLIEMYMDEFDLRRISTQTADPKVVRLAEMIGFKVEGERPLDFMWNKKLYPTYFLGLTREEK